MSELPTIKVKHPARGFAIINESDFDPDLHELVDDTSEGTAEVEALRSRLTRLGVKFHHKAGEEKLREQLNAALDDTSEGLSRRELCADLENLQVEFHPDAPRDELVAAIAKAREEQA